MENEYTKPTINPDDNKDYVDVSLRKWVFIWLLAIIGFMWLGLGGMIWAIHGPGIAVVNAEHGQ